MAVTGKIHSVQTLGTLDGPGIRYVLFMQGCPLRCFCCHNPDTWALTGGGEKTPREVYEEIKRYKSYFGREGGLTVSGGEPLLQAEFVTELFRLCKENGIGTCLDTSGCRVNRQVRRLLTYTDLVLLDIKYTNEADYQKYVGGSYQKTLEFLELLENNRVAAWLRQVMITGVNDDDENLKVLARLAQGHACVKKTELLAFKKLCVSKYEAMGAVFPFAHIPETSGQRLKELTKKLEAY